MNAALDVHPVNGVFLPVRGVLMRRAVEENPEASRIMLGLLDAVEQERAHSQRHLASELGIALGLVNAYLKRCMKKGLVKVREVPARRYAYYLTPQGFAEKSRLTVEYLSYSFGFFRQAKTDCSELFRSAKAAGVKNILLVGQSDLAEIAALCAMEHAVRIVGVVQEDAASDRFIGLPVFADFDAVPEPFDFLLITDVNNARATCEAVVARFGLGRVLVPELLRVRIQEQGGAAE
jgi:DNA-binding MarR family transcriptional regulator